MGSGGAVVGLWSGRPFYQRGRPAFPALGVLSRHAPAQAGRHEAVLHTAAHALRPWYEVIRAIMLEDSLHLLHRHEAELHTAAHALRPSRCRCADEAWGGVCGEAGAGGVAEH